MGKRSASTNANKMPEGLPWFKQAGGIEYVIASVPESAVLAITTSRINVEPDTILDDDDSVAATSRALLALEKVSNETTFEALDPLKDLKIQDIVTVEACQRHAELVSSFTETSRIRTETSRMVSLIESETHAHIENI